MSAQDRPRVVVTHWVHPEVAGYLATFRDPVLPGRTGPGRSPFPDFSPCSQRRPP
ncbi:MAG: hypothetical protein ACR2MP_27625 [Streptosporangiaceae bacterium]